MNMERHDLSFRDKWLHKQRTYHSGGYWILLCWPIKGCFPGLDPFGVMDSGWLKIFVV